MFEIDRLGGPCKPPVEPFLSVAEAVPPPRQGRRRRQEPSESEQDSQLAMKFRHTNSQDCEFEAFVSMLDVGNAQWKTGTPQTDLSAGFTSVAAENLKPDQVDTWKVRCTQRMRRVLTGNSSAVRSTSFAKYVLGLSSSNHTQRLQPLKLRSFPRSQAFDALMYFPSAMVSFMNSGDMQSLSELFMSFMHPTCTISLPRTSIMGQAAPASRFLHFQQLLLDMHPDMILCMNSTNETGNEIMSEIFFKFTENRAIYESVARTHGKRASCLSPLLVPSRAEHLRRKFDITTKTEEEWRGLSGLLDSGADVELFGRIDLQLFFNKHSRRILDMKLNIRLTRCHRLVQT